MRMSRNVLKERAASEGGRGAAGGPTGRPVCAGETERESQPLKSVTGTPVCKQAAKSPQRVAQQLAMAHFVIRFTDLITERANRGNKISCTLTQANNKQTPLLEINGRRERDRERIAFHRCDRDLISF